MKRFWHWCKSLKTKTYNFLAKMPIVGDFFSKKTEREAIEFHALAAQEEDAQHRKWLLTQSVAILGDNAEANLRDPEDFARRMVRSLVSDNDEEKINFTGFKNSDKKIASWWTKAYNFQKIWDTEGMLDAMTFAMVSSDAWAKANEIKLKLEARGSELQNSEVVLNTTDKLMELAKDHDLDAIASRLEMIMAQEPGEVSTEQLRESKQELEEVQEVLEEVAEDVVEASQKKLEVSKQVLEEAKDVLKDIEVRSQASKEVEATSNPGGTRDDIDEKKEDPKMSKEDRRKARKAARRKKQDKIEAMGEA